MTQSKVDEALFVTRMLCHVLLPYIPLWRAEMPAGIAMNLGGTVCGLMMLTLDEQELVIRGLCAHYEMPEAYTEAAVAEIRHPAD